MYHKLSYSHTRGAVEVMIVWWLDLPKQSVPITTNIVMDRCTRHNIM